MPRERKGITSRKSDNQSENRFIIIASEGADTERVYFNAVSEYANKTRLRTVKIEFLERGKGVLNPIQKEQERSKSGHIHVLKQLDKYKKDFNLESNDELWLVIDRDNQNNIIQNIRNIAQKCVQKKYFLGLTNPNFEFWLLLHLKDINEYSNQEKENILKNIRVAKNRKYIDQELTNLLGVTYQKSSYNAQSFITKINFAIQQAEALDNNERWHEDILGTKLHILLKSILRK